LVNPLVIEANAILANKGFAYAFCGGYAIDLFLGYESRKHGDLDVSVYWKDRNSLISFMHFLGFSVYEMLGEGKAHLITDIADQKRVKRNIFCCMDDCELVYIRNTGEKDIFLIDFHHIGQSKLNFIEFIFDDKSDHDFLYARNHNIKRKLEDAILRREGIPYLAPELCLLYKSTDTGKEGYQQDYDLAIPHMNRNQIEWLNAALDTCYAGKHQWIACV
jgi:hypothetical protein